MKPDERFIILFPFTVGEELETILLLLTQLAFSIYIEEGGN